MSGISREACFPFWTRVKNKARHKMKRRREETTVRSPLHSLRMGDGLILARADDSAVILPFIRWCMVFDVIIPGEILRHIVCDFFLPIVNRIRGERSVFKKMAQHMNNPLRCFKLQAPFDGHWLSLMMDRQNVLKTRKIDYRVGEYIKLLNMMLKEKVIETDEVLHVLHHGLLEENPLAFKLVGKAGLLGCFPGVECTIRRASEEWSALPRWEPGDYDRVKPLVLYHLHRKTDEPLLEWLTVWTKKGYNVCKSVSLSNITEAQKEQMDLLCIKQQSPAVRKKRINFMLHGVYSDEEIGVHKK